ncbi:MAG: TPM domain-containing protein [Lachnospiraceae bacterium]|nr:TPM domain-containing protein [Lachnospiraceae bacterium]
MKKIVRLPLFILSFMALVLALVMNQPQSVYAYNPLEDIDDTDVDKTNTNTGYRVVIYDGAGLLDSDEIKQLANDMAPISNFGNVAFVTTDENNYGDIMRYSDVIYDEMFGNRANGVMLIIDMDEREISIYSDGDIHKVITDAYGYDITDNIYRYASNKDYYTCASKGFEQIYAVLNGQKIARPMRYVCSALMALLLSFLINYMVVSHASKIQNTSGAEMLSGANKSLRYTPLAVIKTGETKTYSPQSSGSSGGGGGGGHRGGGGGGGHSGGGGHHGF